MLVYINIGMARPVHFDVADLKYTKVCIDIHTRNTLMYNR